MTKYGFWLGDEEFAIGIYNATTLKVINKDPQYLTFPLLIAFSNAGITFDFTAKNTLTQNYTTTISHLRQFIGRSYQDKYIQITKQLVPFHIGESDNKTPYFRLKLEGKDSDYSPESLMGIFFLQLKYLIKRFNDDQVSDITIAVPEFFTSRQIRALQFCANSAKIKNVRIQYEAEMFACALYHQWRKTIEFGFITMEFNNISYSQVKITKQKGQVCIQTTLAKSAILTQVPEILVRDHIIDKLTSKNIKITEKDKIKLQMKAKELITELSRINKVTLNLEDYQLEYRLDFTPDDLTNLLDPCFDEIAEKIFDTITINNIKYITFMGDIANMKNMIENIDGYFDDPEHINVPNMKAMCALGASLYAHGDYKIIPVVHHNLSIPGQTKNRAYPLVDAFTPLPATGSYIIRPKIKGEGNLLFPIFEGDNKKLSYNNRIGDCTIKDKFDVGSEFEFSLTQNTADTILWSYKVKGSSHTPILIRNFDSFSRSEVIRDLQNSEGIVNTTNQLKERREQLQMLCDKLSKELKGKQSSGRRDNLINQIDAILQWSKDSENNFPTIQLNMEIEDHISQLEMLNLSQFIPLSF